MPSRPTAREIQVIKLIAEGKCSKQIAQELGLSIATVDTHRTNINRGMGFRSAIDLVHYALAEGLTPNQWDGRKIGFRLFVKKENHESSNPIGKPRL